MATGSVPVSKWRGIRRAVVPQRPTRRLPWAGGEESVSIGRGYDDVGEETRLHQRTVGRAKESDSLCARRAGRGDHKILARILPVQQRGGDKTGEVTNSRPPPPLSCRDRPTLCPHPQGGEARNIGLGLILPHVRNITQDGFVLFRQWQRRLHPPT